MNSAASYPLSPDGPLCPLLDDGSLLLSFYEGSGAKPDVKKFIKRHRWPGKPPLSFTVGPEALKAILRNLNGSRESRDILAAATAKMENPPVLHQVIWNWLSVNDAELVNAADEHGEVQGERVFLSPGGLGRLIAAQAAGADGSDRRTRHLVYLALAFAMLQPDDALQLLQTIGQRFPEYRGPIGLDPV